ncbi:MAG: electron transfer flavoprotein subunit beta/FixA family protein [Planctomycetota bacterium]
MNILVLVKRVPATDSQIKVAADGKRYDPAGVEHVLNPYDEYAVEQALQLQAARGGEVTVLTVGGADAQKDLRTCLAMGADKAVLLEPDKAFDSKSLCDALAAKVRELGPELVLCGMKAVDDDDAQVPARLATLLGWSCLTDATALDLAEDGSFTGQRDIEGGKESVAGRLPAVISCNKGLNEPRYPNLKGIMAAKKKPLEQGAIALEEPGAVVEGLTPPPARPAPTILGQGVDAIPALIDKLKNEAKAL